VLLAFLAVSLCPLSLIAYRDSEVTRSALTRSAYQSLFAAASQTALRLDTFMAATANVVGTEAKMPALAEYLSRPAGARAPAKEEDVVDMLEAFAEKNSVFTSSVAVLDLHGRIVLDTQPSKIGLDESATRHFRGALETGLPHAISDLQQPGEGARREAGWGAARAVQRRGLAVHDRRKQSAGRPRVVRDRPG